MRRPGFPKGCTYEPSCALFTNGHYMGYAASLIWEGRSVIASNITSINSFKGCLTANNEAVGHQQAMGQRSDTKNPQHDRCFFASDSYKLNDVFSFVFGIPKGQESR